MIVVLGVQAATATPAPEESEALTIEQAVRLALERHPDIGKARAAAEGLKGKIREVRAQALPEVAVNFNGLRLRDPSLLNASGLDKFPKELRDALVPEGVNLFDYHIRLRQPLYTAGKVGTALKLASVEAEGSLIDIDRAQQDLALEVVRAFYGLLWAERYRELVAQTVEQKRRHAEMARTRFQHGVATEVDVLRSEVALANAQPDLLRAENAVRQARALLNFLLVRPVDFPTCALGDFQQQDWAERQLEELAQDAIRRRPDLHRLRIAERSAAVQLDLARAESRMRADLEAAYGISSRLLENLGNSKYARWTVSVNLTLPVFDGFRRSGLVWQAAAAQRAARLEREKAEQQVRLALQQGLDQLRAAEETIAAARTSVKEAERVLEMMENNYRHGAATTLDVMDAQTALAVARTNLLKGLHDYSIARANLRWAAGRTPWE